MRTPLGRLICLCSLMALAGCSNDPPSELEFVGSFGSFGDAQGRTLLPTSVAVDPEGNTYIADLATFQIRKSSPEGDFIQAWGGWGNDAGEFNGSTHLYFRQNQIYAVSYSLPGRVQIFSTDGAIVESWNLNEQNGKPTKIVVDSQRRVYVLGSTFSGLVLYRYHPGGELDRVIEVEYPSSPPFDLAIGSDDGLYVLFGTGHVQKLDEAGDVVSRRDFPDLTFSFALTNDDGVIVSERETVRHYDEEGTLLLEWSENGANFRDLEVGSDGLIYLADDGNLGVSVYSPDGQLLRRQEITTTETVLFRWPWGIARNSDDELAVLDVGNKRVQWFTPGGALLRVLDLGTRGLQPDFAIDLDGFIYVLTGYQGVRKLAPTGDLVWAWPSLEFDPSSNLGGVAVTEDGRVYASDFRDETVYALDSDGSKVWERQVASGVLFGGIAASPDGGVLVLGEAKLTHLSAEGETVRVFPVEAGAGGGITVDERGRLFLTLPETGEIMSYSLRGLPLGRWGRQGTAPGELLSPAGIVTLPGGEILVTDLQTHRVSRFELIQAIDTQGTGPMTRPQ